MQVQELDRSECLELLGSRTVGRVALSTGGGLTILPVNHVVHEGSVVEVPRVKVVVQVKVANFGA